MTRKLAARGAAIYIGHQAANLGEADTVIISSAISPDNPEVLAANERGLPVLKRADFLGQLIGERTCVAVAGTHGKTTTTALIAFLLTRAGNDPSYIVGSTIADLGTNAHHGSGREFVIEADEYDNMFLGLTPNVAVLTHVEHDHPDFFPTTEAYFAAFERFVSRLPADGTLIACADNEGAQAIGKAVAARGTTVIWYGLKNGAHWKADDVQANGAGGSDFVVTRRGATVGLIRTRLPGLHNVANCLAALAVVDALGVDFNTARAALADFLGVGRRFEVKGEVNGITVVDDYAHHPTEIRATLSAARRRFGQRPLWAMFQPHTFSRTRALLAAFAASFGDADHVLLTDIYRSREPFDPTISAKHIMQQMTHPDVRHVPTLDDAVRCLLDELKPGAVLITLGAGDGNVVGERVLEVLKHGG